MGKVILMFSTEICLFYVLHIRPIRVITVETCSSEGDSSGVTETCYPGHEGCDIDGACIGGSGREHIGSF